MKGEAWFNPTLYKCPVSTYISLNHCATDISDTLMDLAPDETISSDLNQLS